MTTCPECQGRTWLTWDVALASPRFGLVVPCPTCTPPSQRTLDNYDGSVHPTARIALTAARAWPDPPWLGITGAVGCGKTHLLTGLADRLLRHRTPYTVRTWDALWEAVTAAWSMAGEQRLIYETELRRLLAAPWPLLIDDLAAGRHLSGAEWDMLDKMLEQRYSPPLPTAWTTNLTFEAFKRQLPRAASRCTEIGVWRPIEASDYRVRLGRERTAHQEAPASADRGLEAVH